jgi:hypothetical protein
VRFDLPAELAEIRAAVRHRRSASCSKPPPAIASRRSECDNPSVGADPLLAPIEGADRRELGGVEVDIVPAGNARVKRAIYPPGFRWSRELRELIGTELCMHAHVGFLARGHIAGEYADGCRFEYVAPAVIAIEPEHDAWVIGDEPAVVIQFDYESETARRLGLPERHRHESA